MRWAALWWVSVLIGHFAPLIYSTVTVSCTRGTVLTKNVWKFKHDDDIKNKNKSNLRAFVHLYSLVSGVKNRVETRICKMHMLTRGSGAQMELFDEKSGGQKCFGSVSDFSKSYESVSDF
jgi:hypothetical protein